MNRILMMLNVATSVVNFINSVYCLRVNVERSKAELEYRKEVESASKSKIVCGFR